MSSGTQPDSNIGTVTNARHSRDIILTGFGITGALAGLFVFFPEAAAENVVAGVTGGIIGFLAGRKK